MIKYIGQGDYIHGVPARDLTEKEWDKFKRFIKKQEKIANKVLYKEENINSQEK